MIDASQAFLQASLITPSQRVRLIPPKTISCPWTGKVSGVETEKKKLEWRYLTLRPLYGTVCAPLRWFRKISSLFVQHGWAQMRTDPFTYRLSINHDLAALAVIHVDDILLTSGAAGETAFMKVVGRFKHSGIDELSAHQSLTYLWLDLYLVGKAIRVSQKEFAQLKLYEVDLNDVIRGKCFCINMERRRTITRQVI